MLNWISKHLNRYILGRRIERGDFILVFKHLGMFEYYMNGFNQDELNAVYSDLSRGLSDEQKHKDLNEILKENGIKFAEN